ncbi:MULTISPECIES: hypothetical protein [Vibrio]|nr:MULTISPECIES: hypothetical protein [Vibrio]
MNAVTVLCLIAVSFALLMLFMPSISKWAENQLEKYDKSHNKDR